MPKMPVFGYGIARAGLIALGFIIDTKRGKGDHDLAMHPTRKPYHERQRPFITVPHWKEYGSPDFRSDFIREIMAFGFTRDEVISALNGMYDKRTKKKAK